MNGKTDSFVRDRKTGTTTLVSMSSSGVRGNDDSIYPTVSTDGRFVAFFSFATNLVAGDTNGWSDAFVRDREARDDHTGERESVRHPKQRLHLRHRNLGADGGASSPFSQMRTIW